MRRLSQLSLHLSLGISLIGFTAAPVFAQDLGTYRPGQAYQSVTSPSADVCNSHCAGDAQCNAWNYVKVNPQASGVCEFLSSASTPVQSAISISGENTNQSRFSSRTTQGSTNTVRVGTRPAPAPAKPSVTTAPTRRVVREAVPQRVTPQATAYRNTQQQDPRALQQQRIYQQKLQQQRLQQQQQLQQQKLQRQAALQRQRQARPQFQPLLDAPAVRHNVPNRAASRPVAPQQNLPQNSQSLREQLRQNQARQGHTYQGQNPQAQPQQSAKLSRGQSDGRPPIGKPIGPVSDSIAKQNARLQRNSSVNLPRSSASAPVTHQNAREAFARRQADLAAIASGNSVDPITKSLYGSLNDDVKVRAPQKSLPNDPTAPIPTSAARPVTPVQTQPLASVDELAGGPR